MNLFEGRLIEDEPDHVRIESPELDGTIYVDHGVSSAPDAVVSAAVRPEKISISVEPPQQTDNVARGVVKEIAYMGDMSRVPGAARHPARWCASRSRTLTGTPTIDHLGPAGVSELACVQPGGAERMSARAEAPQPSAPQRGRAADPALPRAACRRIAGRSARLVRWGLTGPHRRHRRAVPVAAAVLPGPVHHRAEDRVLRNADRACRRTSRCSTWIDRQRSLQIKLNCRQLPVPGRGQPVLEGVSQLAEGRGDLDAAVPADRLSDGVRDRARATPRGATSC